MNDRISHRLCPAYRACSGTYHRVVRGLVTRIHDRPAGGLRSFDNDRRQHGAIQQVEIGMADIPLKSIVGSVGRTSDFDRNFRPQRRHLQERLERLGEAYPGSDFPVIDVYEMVGQYYVVDGHHRVALARRRGASYITAKVVQVRLPGMHPPTRHLARAGFRELASEDVM
jgi:hypothetical protein